MHSRKVAQLERRVLEAPGDDEAWLELARNVARTGHRPAFLEPAHGARLVELLARHPGERGLVGLALPLLGLELAPARGGVAGAFWHTTGRLAHTEDHAYDRETGLPLRVRRPQDGLEMGLVPGGSFKAGCAVRFPSEWEEHERETSAFYLDVHPVTVAAYEAFMAETGRFAPSHWETQMRRGRRPVVFVDWNDVSAYGAWAGGRLPFETEWEKAARGVDGRPYPWGESLPDRTVGNYDRDDGARSWYDWDRHLEEVGRYPTGAAPFGHMEMIGHVWEWCQDMVDTQPLVMASMATSMVGVAAARGGGWMAHGKTLRASFRNGFSTLVKDSTLGFRLARSIP